MSIENIIENFEMQLRSCGLSETNGALLLQLNIDGITYIKHSGDLNNLNANSTTLLKREEHHHSFIDFMRIEIDKAIIAESTKKLHENTLKLLLEFNNSIDIKDITTSFLYELEHFMTKKKFAINTIGRHMKVIKRYIRIALRKDLISKYPFNGYSIKSSQSSLNFLSEKDLSLLEKYEPKEEEEKEVLQAFLFSCYTGLRYSDVCRITKQDIQSLNRKKWIVMQMQKTNREIRVPISTIFEGKGLKISKEIKRSRGYIFRFDNYPKMSRKLKHIIKLSGIKKKITFHSARHTCATLLLYKGVNITTVQKILGHKSVKTTQIYAEITDQTIEKDLKRSNRRKS